MKPNHTRLTVISLLTLALHLLPQALAISISLNDVDLFADPTVTFAPDGSSAALTEDPARSVVLLSNDPGLGDPVIIRRDQGVILTFDFVFLEGGVGNIDQFGAFILDDTGSSAGPDFEFFANSTSSGTVRFDLRSLSAVPALGVQFQLASLPGDASFDSSVRVSNVRLDAVPDATSTLASLLVAVFGLAIFRRRCGSAASHRNIRNRAGTCPKLWTRGSIRKCEAVRKARIATVGTLGLLVSYATSSFAEVAGVDDLQDLTGVVTIGFQSTVYNRRSGIETLEARLVNLGTDGIQCLKTHAPLAVIVDSISDSSVRLLNFTGFTSDGKPYVDMSAALDTDGVLDPDEESLALPLRFSNPSRRRWDMSIRIRGASTALPEQFVYGAEVDTGVHFAFIRLSDGTELTSVAFDPVTGAIDHSTQRLFGARLLDLDPSDLGADAVALGQQLFGPYSRAARALWRTDFPLCADETVKRVLRSQSEFLSKLIEMSGGGHGHSCGCTASPDTVYGVSLTDACCNHDEAYARGGTEEDRARADLQLKNDIEQAMFNGTGSQELAEDVSNYYYWGVSLAGWIFFDYHPRDPHLTLTTEGSGTVILTPPGGSYVDGDVVTLTATPSEGWTFLRWQGDASGTNAITALVMTRDKSVEAVFGPR